MEKLDEVLLSDDKDIGGLYTDGKGPLYLVALLLYLPVLIIPYLYTFLNRNIYRLTVGLVLYFLCILTLVYFRYYYILRIHDKIQELLFSRV